MKLGFIGFGEVGYEISRGLKTEGLQGIVAYDIAQEEPKLGQLVRERAAKTEVTLLDTPSAVVNAADVIIAAVPGSEAVKAAESAIASLCKGKIYVDVSTSSPTAKQKIAALVEPTGALFADAGMMGALPLKQHKVPTLLSGSGASQYIEMMSPYHMSLEKVSDKAGDAIAIKLVRSVYMKGVMSLSVEMLEAATKLGVENLVLDSLSNTLDGLSFLETINYLVPSSAIHAGRQSHEMSDCMVMLNDIGVKPTMTKSTMLRLQWLADKKLKEIFQGKVPAKWEEVVQAWGA